MVSGRLPRQERLTTSPYRVFGVQTVTKQILAQTLSELPEVRGNLIHDLQTAVLMRDHGIVPICTRNTDFHRFPFLEVVDPLR